MLAQLQQIGHAAARAATVELGQRSLGAINEVTLDSVDLLRDENGTAYYVLRFAVLSTGLKRIVPMAWLPEFMDGDPDVEWYIETMCSFIIDRTLGENEGITLGSNEDEGMDDEWAGEEED